MVAPAAAPSAAPPAAVPVAAALDVPGASVQEQTDEALLAVKSYLKELEKKPDARRAARLHYECARLYEFPIGDHKSAAEHYQKARAGAPDHLAALEGSRRMLSAQKNYQAMVSVLEAEAKVSSDPKRQAAALFKKGRVLEDHLGDLEAARSVYAQALGYSQTDIGLLKAVEHAQRHAKKHAELSRTLELEAHAVHADARYQAALIARRARLLEVTGSDAGSAAELFQSAFNLDPASPGVLPALKRLHYFGRRWHDLVKTLKSEADQVTDPRVRSMALYNVGRVEVDLLGEVDAGIEALEQARQETPDDMAILDELARLYDLADRPRDLANVLEKLAGLEHSTVDKVGHLQRIAQLCEQKLGSPETAITWYERALELDPSYLPAVEALSNLYAARGQWQSLAIMRAKQADRAKDPLRRASSFATVAEIYETKLGETEQAVAHHVRALGIVPGYSKSFRALSRLYNQNGRYRELIELYERAIELARDNDAKIAYLFKIGRLLEDALNTPAQAISTYKRILQIDPKHLPAVHAWQRAAERGQRYKELIQALETEASKTVDKAQRVALLHRAGEVSETELGDTEGALAFYGKVTALDPVYPPVLANLAGLYQREKRWEDLLEVYRAELKVTEKGDKSAALWFKMGQLCEEHIGRVEEAVQCYRQACEAYPKHRSAALALARNLSSKQQWQELVNVLEQQISATDDKALKARLACRVAEVYENQLALPERALSAYRKALAEVSDHRLALEGQARLLTVAKDWRELASQLDREAEKSEDPVTQVFARLRQAEVWRDELRDPRRAIQSYEAVLERDPSHLGALLALESLYIETDQLAKAEKVYASLSAVTVDPAVRAFALRELSRLQEKRGSVEEAKQSYQGILQLLPNDVGALSALEQVALLEQDRALLAQVDAKLGEVTEHRGLKAAYRTRLAEVLEGAGDPACLDLYREILKEDPENLAAARGLARLADRANDPALLSEAAEREAHIPEGQERAAGLLVRAAELFMVRQGGTEAAVAALERALELSPDNESAAQKLRELLLARKQIDRLLGSLTHAAQNAKNPEGRAAIWIQVAELLADKKNDVGAGLAALKRVQQQQPNHVQACLMLGDLYARDGQWQKALEQYETVLKQKPGPELVIEANLRLAPIADEQLGDGKRAVVALRAVLEVDPKNRWALSRLLNVQRKAGDFEQAAETARNLFQVSTSTEDRALALADLARLERDQGRHEEALEAYERAVKLAGNRDNIASEFLELVRMRRGQSKRAGLERYVAALTSYLEQPGEAQELGSVYLELGKTLDDELNQPEDALVALYRGVEQAPGDAALREELAARLKRHGRYEQALEQLRRLLDVDALRPNVWHNLVEVLDAMQLHAESALAIGPLLALGQANDLQAATWASRPSRAGAVHPGSFDTEAFVGIDALADGDVGVELLAALAEGLGKVHPPELDRYGLSTKDRIGARSTHPLRAVADRVAAAFGVHDFDLYLHRAHGGGIEVEFTDPVGILVPSTVSNLSETQQMFVLARPLANISRKLHAIDKLSPRALQLFLAAAVRHAVPGFGAELGDEEYLNQHSRKVFKSVPWLSRGRVDELSQLYSGVAPANFEDWVRRIRLTAARAALLLCDDLPGAIDQVRRTEGDLAGLTGENLLAGQRLVNDLLRFWISQPAIDLRRRLGMF